MNEPEDVAVVVQATTDGHYCERTVMATPVGKYLAVHAELDGSGFTVTHRPTGLVAMITDTRALAMEAAKSLEREDWNFDKPTRCPAATKVAGLAVKAKYEGARSPDNG